MKKEKKLAADYRAEREELKTHDRERKNTDGLRGCAGFGWDRVNFLHSS